jgi:peptide/nickel transport system substrate-binding protein
MHFRPLIVVAAAASLALTACSGSTSGTTSKDGSITIGVGEGPTGTMDWMTFPTGQDQTFVYNIYETLVDQDATGAVQPLLATEWSQDGTTWTFDLRTDVTFHGGEEFDSGDVLATFERALDPARKSLAAEFWLGGITDVSAPSPTEFVVETEKFDSTIPQKLSQMPIYEEEFANSERPDTEEDGTGPYVVADYQKGQSLKLEEFDDYWGDQPDYASAEIRFIPDEAVRMSALKAGEINMAWNIPGDLAAGQDNAIFAPSNEVMSLRQKLLEPSDPLLIPEVREALSLAIDRTSICDTLFVEQCRQTAGQIITPEVFGYNPDLAEPEYDPEKARQLLESVDAVGTTITVGIPTGRWAHARELGQILEQAWTEVGFNVEATYEEAAKWVEQYLAVATDPSKAADISLLGMSNDFFHSQFSLDNSVACGAVTSGICDEELDQRIKDADLNPDVDSQMAAYQDIWSTIVDEHYFTPLFSLKLVHLGDGSFSFTPRARPSLYVKDIEAAQS